MSEDLDKRVRAALQPIDPGEGFTARVMSRIAAGEAASPRVPSMPPHFRFAWLPAALAASILAVVVVRHERELRREEGLAARAQVIEALRLTSGKLDLAFQLVSAPRASHDPPSPGAS
jgi:hypothetical protein